MILSAPPAGGPEIARSAAPERLRLQSRIRFAWQTIRRLANLHLRPVRTSGHRTKAFDEVERMLLFVGYPRSGSSLLGALLNTHPEVAIAHELDVCWYVERGVSRERLFALLLRRHDWFASRGWEWTGYDYRVPGTHQGTFRRLTVLGDKRARGTAVALGSDPRLLDELRRTVGVPLRFVHQVRNPFDNITTMAKRNDLPLPVAAHRYFALAADVARIRRDLDEGEILDLRHEDLIARPRETLARCFSFLGLDVDDDLLTACGKSVFASPKRTRDSVDWPPDLVERVLEGIESHPWLDGYTR